MNGFSGINQFGSVTTQAGQKLAFKDFDKDGDGKISQEEFEALLGKIQTDQVDIPTVQGEDTTKFNDESQAVFEQEVEMEKALDDLKSQISIDFCGDNSKYIADIAFDLKDFLEEFKSSYEGDVSGMSAAFKEALPSKYEELKISYLGRDPKEVKGAVLDEIIESLVGKTDENNLQLLGQFLELEADNFIAAYDGEDLTADLKEHLESYMGSSYEKMKEPIAEYQAFSDSLGTYVDSNEFEQLKEKAMEFIQTALEKGIHPKYGSSFRGKIIRDEASLQRFFSEIENAQDLREKMNKIILNLNNTLSLLEKIEEGYITEANLPELQQSNTAAEESTAEQTDMSMYQVEPSNISISGNYESKIKRSDLDELLLKDSIKNQFKLQLINNLAAQGISFADIEATFNNVYASSINEYIANIPDSSYQAFSNKYVRTETIIEDFAKIFNNNMVNAINENNKSSIDFDLNNIDVSTYLEGMFGLDVDISSKKYDNLKPQLKAEAIRMCRANGVEYDDKTFQKILYDAYHNGGSINDFLTNFQTEFSIWVYSNKY